MTRKTAVLAILGAAVLAIVALGMKSQFDFYRQVRVLPLVGGAALGLILISLAIARFRGGRLALAAFVIGGAAVAAVSVLAHEREHTRQLRANELEQALHHAATGVCAGTSVPATGPKTILQVVSKGGVSAVPDLPAPNSVAELHFVACRTSFDSGCGKRVTLEIRDARTAGIVATRTFPETLPPGCDPLAIAPGVERIGEPPDERAIAAFVKSVFER